MENLVEILIAIHLICGCIAGIFFSVLFHTAKRTLELHTKKEDKHLPSKVIAIYFVSTILGIISIILAIIVASSLIIHEYKKNL